MAIQQKNDDQILYIIVYHIITISTMFKSSILYFRKLPSKIDASTNFIFHNHIKGAFEARYVRRNADKVSAYLSSHTGCSMGCQMCFLTHLGENSMKHAKIKDYEEQFKIIMNHYFNEDKKSKTCKHRFYG